MDRLFALRLVAFAVLAGAAGLGAVAMTRSEEAVPAAAYKPAPFVAAPKAVAPVAVPPPAPTSAPTPAPSPTPEPYVVKRVMTLPGPLTHGRHYWDEAGVPDGPIVITVDLAAQVLSVFRGGYEIGTAVILYGATDKPTPLGSFPILMKDAHHVSSLYGAPMPYTMRLTNDGVAVHGTRVAWGYATHGCIGVPIPFAKLLFRVAKVGDRVIITRGKTLATGETLVS